MKDDSTASNKLYKNHCLKFSKTDFNIEMSRFISSSTEVAIYLINKAKNN